VLLDFPYELAPGAEVFVTTTANIKQTTVNTATWQAFNPGPVDIVSGTDSATVNVVDSAPFPSCVDFEGGTLPDFMYPQTISTPPANGRVQVTTSFPHSGTYALDLDTDCDGCGGSTQQSATMVVDLAGRNDVLLDFWVYEHGDENNPEDGVFISDDGGATWVQIVNLNNFPANYENVVLDLAAEATGAGMDLVDGFRIRFQSLDNFSIPTDGYSFDDVCVRAGPAVELVKTVGTDPATCAATTEITVPPNTEVTYCYEVANTGGVALALHDLVDGELGQIVGPDFPFSLQPAESVAITQTATIMTTTVNSAEWTAYNPGPTDVVTATAAATVTVSTDPDIVVDPLSLSVDRPPGATVTETLTISNTGFGPLAWDVVEAFSDGGSGCVPADLPWLSVTPTGGTTNPGSIDAVDVVLDSTGLIAGTYNATLCLNSSDPDTGPGNGTGLVRVPVTLTVEAAPSIELAKTVGLDPAVCAGTDTLTVNPHTTVYYCYQVTNTGNITLTHHDLVDGKLGNLLTGFAYDLAPGASVNTVEAGAEFSAELAETTVNTATWTAYDAGQLNTAVATASATVTVEEFALYLPLALKP
jgi:hypothetical protein